MFLKKKPFFALASIFFAMLVFSGCEESKKEKTKAAFVLEYPDVRKTLLRLG